MKTKTLPERTHARRTVRQPKRNRTDGQPPVAARSSGLHEPARCERCDARYENRTWRVPAVRRKPADLASVNWTLCPACKQIEDQEYFGRVLVTRPLTPERETEVRRRIWNVERRARYTQAERRMVQLEHRRSGLEVLTTSQKLAHRIARELEKAFGGQAHYEWSERGGELEATWDPGPIPALELVRPRSPRSPRTKKRRG
jgi:hypothetical protein